MKAKEIKILTETLSHSTKGAGDLIDLTAEIQEKLEASGLAEGSVTVFVIGSTAGITTFEYENGLIADMRETYEKLAPSNRSYHHDNTWGDNNGFSHVRAALQGPSLTVPFSGGKLCLGTWQQIVLAEFDHRPRQRKIVVQLTGI
jgi:secondary thiamine-phosphate synthase enzyme